MMKPSSSGTSRMRRISASFCEGTRPRDFREKTEASGTCFVSVATALRRAFERPFCLSAHLGTRRIPRPVFAAQSLLEKVTDRFFAHVVSRKLCVYPCLQRKSTQRTCDACPRRLLSQLVDALCQNRVHDLNSQRMLCKTSLYCISTGSCLEVSRNPLV